jgi:hypothetical protein
VHQPCHSATTSVTGQQVSSLDPSDFVACAWALDLMQLQSIFLRVPKSIYVCVFVWVYVCLSLMLSVSEYDSVGLSVCV